MTDIKVYQELLEACERKDIDTVKRCMGEGAREFFEACKKGDTKKVKELLGAGVNPNIRTDIGATGLHLASSNGHIKIVLMLIKTGADVNDQGAPPKPRSMNFVKVTPLMMAKQFKQPAISKALTANGAR